MGKFYDHAVNFNCNHTSRGIQEQSLAGEQCREDKIYFGLPSLVAFPSTSSHMDRNTKF